jgi:hypothetical protein
LGPQRRISLSSGCEHDAIGKRQLGVNSDLCRSQRQRGIEVYDSPLLHQCYGLQRWAFTTLLTYSFEDFQQADRRDD